MSAQRTIGVDVGGPRIVAGLGMRLLTAEAFGVRVLPADLGFDASVIGEALVGFEARDTARVPAIGR
jgi:hypothetical protein